MRRRRIETIIAGILLAGFLIWLFYTPGIDPKIQNQIDSIETANLQLKGQLAQREHEIANGKTRITELEEIDRRKSSELETYKSNLRGQRQALSALRGRVDTSTLPDTIAALIASFELVVENQDSVITRQEDLIITLRSKELENERLISNLELSKADQAQIISGLEESIRLKDDQIAQINKRNKKRKLKSTLKAIGVGAAAFLVGVAAGAT